jgi:hypothetical protein
MKYITQEPDLIMLTSLLLYNVCELGTYYRDETILFYF